jgi:hypothetical protein
MTPDPPEPSTPSSSRHVGVRVGWALLALVLVVAVIQLAVSAPGGSSHSTPDSVTTCNFLFPHSELPSNHVAASIVEEFRYRCERGMPLPK